MIIIGISVFIPYMMNLSGYFSMVNTSTMMAYMVKFDEDTMSNLVEMS